MNPFDQNKKYIINAVSLLQKIADEQGKKVVKQHFSSISDTVISMKRAVDKMVVQGRINDVFIVSCSRTPLGSFKGTVNLHASTFAI